MTFLENCRDLVVKKNKKESASLRPSRSLGSRIHGLIHRIEAFAQVSRVGFVLVGRGTCGTLSNAFEKLKNMAPNMNPSRLAWVRLSINTSMFATQGRFGRNAC
ncbi:hypothetical protein T265_10748 [Opisthorchis viverrini]|uniref:Uncharacterized protein n=1 Tax=Opisthorchis viverrini TaxID=6198 RepID=A0A074Z5H5_OPIVI|nr:hypothetical protein T265_10748 [Opisthorchis viverrini]KER20777.1 hypothetical protein T265_10748 [Opisthorchis viverrini]